MPLIVPGLQSTTSNPSQSWFEKLAGKTISTSGPSTDSTFAKSELPKNHRVVEEGGIMTMDFNPDRMNVFTDKDGIVKKVTHG